MLAAADEDNYTGRLVRKYVNRACHEGHVVSCTVLNDVATQGGGGAASAFPSAATKLWRVHFDNIEDEDLLTPDLEAILAPGFRRGFAPKGKAAETVFSLAPIVARKVAELPPPRSAAANAAAPPKRAPSASAQGAKPPAKKKRVAAPPPAPEPAQPDVDPLSLCTLDMRGAAVSDDALPPLAHGEVRVLGQTLTRTVAMARSRHVAAWRKQPRETAQWAEILTPMAEADKAAKLRSLHAYLGLKNGEELRAAMPADPPCNPLVEEFIIPADDPRVGLRGQAGVRVKLGGPALPRHAVLGPYRAFTSTHDEYNNDPAYKYGIDPRVKRYGVEARQTGPVLTEVDGLRSKVETSEDELLFDSFGTDYDNWNQRPGVGDNPLPVLPGVEPPAEAPASLPPLVASAFGFGNLMCLINDGQGPVAKSAPPLSDAEHDKCCSARLIEILVHGWPAIFVISERKVAPGEELFLLYGPGYWDHLRQLACRLNAHRGELEAAVRRGASEPLLQLGSGGSGPSAAPQTLTASGGEGGGSASEPEAAAATEGQGSDKPAPQRVQPPSLFASGGRDRAAPLAVRFDMSKGMPRYDGATFDRDAAKREAAKEGSTAFEPAACAANFEATAAECDGSMADVAGAAEGAARALSAALGGAASEAPAEAGHAPSAAEVLQLVRAAAEQKAAQLARDVAGAR